MPKKQVLPRIIAGMGLCSSDQDNGTQLLSITTLNTKKT